MLETRSEVANRASDAGINGVFRAAGRGGMVSLIQDEERAGTEVVEPVAEGRGVGFINQQFVRNQETREGGPRIDAVATVLADAINIGAVKNLESQTEAGFEFILPLPQHRRRTGDDDFTDAAAQEKFTGDEGGFDGFAEANVVGDE